MPNPLILQLTIARSQIVSLGRQLTRLYRTSNAAEFRGHGPGGLVCSRIEGQARAGEMVYTLELTPAPHAAVPEGADWSILEAAVTQPAALPHSPDSDLPVLSHSPGPLRQPANGPGVNRG